MGWERSSKNSWKDAVRGCSCNHRRLWTFNFRRWICFRVYPNVIWSVIDTLTLDPQFSFFLRQLHNSSNKDILVEIVNGNCMTRVCEYCRYHNLFILILLIITNMVDGAISKLFRVPVGWLNILGVKMSKWLWLQTLLGQTLKLKSPINQVALLDLNYNITS